MEREPDLHEDDALDADLDLLGDPDDVDTSIEEQLDERLEAERLGELDEEQRHPD